MKKLRVLVLALVTAMLLIAPSMKVNAKEPVKMYVFYGATCPHCEALFEYLDKVDDATKEKFTVEKYETWNDTTNNKLMDKVATVLKTDKSKLGVPYIIIGEKAIIGFAEDGNYEKQIINAIEEEYENEDRYDIMDHIDKEKNSDIEVIVALSVIAVGIIGLLVYAKTKTK